MAVIHKRTSCWLLLVIIALLAACGSNEGSSNENTSTDTGNVVGEVVKTEKGQFTNISPDELKTMLAKKDFFLVDVHIPNEGKLPDLDARIPYNEITQHLDELPQDKGAKIVLTCRSDHMSTIASTELANLGYTNVFNLEGGFNAWKAKGYPFTPEP